MERRRGNTATGKWLGGGPPAPLIGRGCIGFAGPGLGTDKFGKLVGRCFSQNFEGTRQTGDAVVCRPAALLCNVSRKLARPRAFFAWPINRIDFVSGSVTPNRLAFTPIRQWFSQLEGFFMWFDSRWTRKLGNEAQHLSVLGRRRTKAGVCGGRITTTGAFR